MSYGRGFQDTLSLREAMNRLFEESFVQQTGQRRRGGQQSQAQSIPVNIFDEGDNITVFAPMPGLQPENIEITANNGILTLSGEQRGPGQERHEYSVHEWTIGPYQRSVPLPEGVDVESARASYDNGVLVVTFNKAEPNRPRRIQVKSGQE